MSAASRSLIDELQRAILRGGLIALLVGGVAGGAVALSLIVPLRRLADGMRRYQAGERGARVELGGRDEVAELARVFNQTATALEAELAQRRRLTSDIAHELRTPLTVLKSELEAIQDGLMNPDAERIGELLGQVNVLARLVSDLRLLSLAEEGGLELRRERLELGALLERVLRGFERSAAAAGVELCLVRPAGDRPAWVEGDPERLHQVVAALIDNALRYGAAGRRMELVLEPGSERHAVVVRDFGPGFFANDLPFVFQRLYTGSASRSRGEASASQGSGLGLSIVAALVALHGGAVEAANHPGGGAVLRVALPSAGG